MEHFFELPVKYKGSELLLKGRLVTFAYTYKFYIIAEGKELVFELDDEHRFRALNLDANPTQEADKELILEIIRVLEQIQSA